MPDSVVGCCHSLGIRGAKQTKSLHRAHILVDVNNEQINIYKVLGIQQKEMKGEWVGSEITIG